MKNLMRNMMRNKMKKMFKNHIQQMKSSGQTKKKFRTRVQLQF